MTTNEARPVIATAQEMATTLSIVAEPQRPVVTGLLSEPGFGLSCFKMRNDLSEAAGLMFAFDGKGFPQNNARRRRIREFATMLGNPAAGDLILEAATAVERRLRVFSLPVPFVAMELGEGTVKEMKSYVRTDRASEKITLVDGNIYEKRIVCRRPSPKEEIAVAGDVIDLIRPDVRPEAMACMKRMHLAGASLEMIGIDVSPTMGTDAKLYFSPVFNAEAVETGFTAQRASTVVWEALSACGREDDMPRAMSFIEGLIGLGMPCNLIAVGFRADGSMETKINFDAWNSQASDPALIVSRETAEEGMKLTYEAAGLPLGDIERRTFIDRIEAGDMVVDTFALDILPSGCGAKTYVRSRRDVGAGITMFRGYPLLGSGS